MTSGQVVPCRATSDCLDAKQPMKGPRAMQSVFDILMLLLGVARTFIFIHFIMSWLISFEVLNVRQPFVGQVWYTLQRILEPIYGPIRRVLPDLGGIDLSPIVALLGIEVIRIVLINNIGLFY
jgi:YggT family protein